MITAPLIHGFDPSARAAAWTCFNLALNGQLVSSDFTGAMMGADANHKSIDQLSIDEIKAGSFQGVLSPSSAVILAAALARQKVTLWNIDQPYSAEQCQARADVEIEFEKVRRVVAPHKVSRLSCLYCANNNDEGRKMVTAMFRGIKMHFLDVAILRAGRIAKVDSTHFDEFCLHPHQGHALAYWEGTPSAKPKWEYLLDGAIQALERKQIDQACLMHWNFNKDWWNTNHPPEWFMSAVSRAMSNSIET
jgi:hypothetical protein